MVIFPVAQLTYSGAIKMKNLTVNVITGETTITDDSPEYVPSTPISDSMRQERDNILTTVVDPLVSNPLRWAGLSSDKQAEWATYRTALLDVPQQAGFPDTITWPTKP